MRPTKVDYDKSWDIWGEDFKKLGASSRHTRRMLTKFLKDQKFNSIIDIGCGTGIFLESLGLQGKKTAGIDISSSGINACRKKMPEGNFKVIDIGKCSPGGEYDIGICSEVLEHVKDDQKAIFHIRKLCKKVIISVPCGRYGNDDRDQGHFRRYTEDELLGKLRKAGFKVLKHEKWGFPFYSPIYRFLMNSTTPGQKSGKVTIFKRLASEFFYFLFFFNIKGKGDRLFVLAE